MTTRERERLAARHEYRLLHSGLFAPLHRAANSVDQAVQGAGPGLAIVRDIVTEHGGSVSARSEAGRGSVFTVTPPVLSTGPVEVAHS